MHKIKKLQNKKLLAERREMGIVSQPKIKRTKMADSKCKQRIVLDMAYDDLMKPKVYYFLKFVFFNEYVLRHCLLKYLDLKSLFRL